MTFSALGDAAVVVSFGDGIDAALLPRLRALTLALETNRPRGIVDVVPAYSTVTVFYDVPKLGPEVIRPYDHVCQVIRERARHLDSDAKKKTAAGRAMEIPVCFGGEFGPDLAYVAELSDRTPAEVVKLYQGADYIVHALGFVPGFPYLGGLPPELHTPRKATPRTSVAAGSVAIGGAQTGIYPLATPGGWNVIGRTPIVLFRLEEAEPAFLRVGDRVKFLSISEAEFAEWI